MANNIQGKTISVVMCTYNGEQYIREQLDSILRQTRPANEIIIQDDCSTDKTYDILCEYQKKYPSVHVFRNQQNMGINPNFFSALEKASGDYIAISDQDDIWEDYKLEMQLQNIGDNLLCGGRSTPFSTTGAAIRVDSRIPNYCLLRQMLVGTMPGHVLFFSKELLSKIPDISRFTAIRCYDSILLIVAGAYDNIEYIDKNLVNQRRYVEAATYTVPLDNQKSISNMIKTIHRTWIYNKQLKPIIKERLTITLDFLKHIDSKEMILKDAIQMIELYISSSFIDFFRLEWFCIKHYKQLFHSSDVNGIMGRLRAMYFPISLSDYYRYLL